MLNSQELTSFISIYPFRIRTVSALFVVTMYNYHPRLLAKSNIEKQYFSHRVNDVCNGSPSRIRKVRRISFGMTIRPRSSTRRTIPVAFISFPLLVPSFQWYCLQEKNVYAVSLLTFASAKIGNSNASDISQKQITHMTGISQTGHSKFETGENDIPPLLIQLVDFLNPLWTIFWAGRIRK